MFNDLQNMGKYSLIDTTFPTVCGHIQHNIEHNRIYSTFILRKLFSHII